DTQQKTDKENRAKKVVSYKISLSWGGAAVIQNAACLRSFVTSGKGQCGVPTPGPVINITNWTGVCLLVIKEADQGGAVVIMDKSSYTQEVPRQLSNNKFYQPLTTDPATKYQKELQNLMKHLPGNVREQILQNTPQELQPATFNLLPKYTNNQASTPSQLKYLATWTTLSKPMLPMHPIM
ncbi:hypothetical protein JRQ81_001714, partial [Phrynocephalus forsythii]